MKIKIAFFCLPTEQNKKIKRQLLNLRTERPHWNSPDVSLSMNEPKCDRKLCASFNLTMHPLALDTFAILH